MNTEGFLEIKDETINREERKGREVFKGFLSVLRVLGGSKG